MKTADCADKNRRLCRWILKKRAFTLIEVMLAGIILVIALGGLLDAFSGNFGLLESGRDLSVAVNHARCVMEEIRALNIPDLVTAKNWATWAQRDITHPDGGGGCNTLNNESIAVSYPSGTAARPLQILVTVNWTGRGRARSTQLVTLLGER